MWGTDMTTTVTTEEGMASEFVAVDHCSVDCVGIHAAKSGNRFEALEPIRQGVAERFQFGLEADVAEALKVRHDHGPAYLSDDFQREIAYLGMTSSPSFVRAPEGNGYCEWFIRILKENLLWVRSFATVEELRWALLEFKNLYNHHWIPRGLRLPNAGPGKAGKTRSSCGGRMRSNTLTRVSNNPGAVQPDGRGLHLRKRGDSLLLLRMGQPRHQ